MTSTRKRNVICVKVGYEADSPLFRKTWWCVEEGWFRRRAVSLVRLATPTRAGRKEGGC